jgi:DNA-directed RNA polymerase subunit F
MSTDVKKILHSAHDTVQNVLQSIFNLSSPGEQKAVKGLKIIGGLTLLIVLILGGGSALFGVLSMALIMLVSYKVWNIYFDPIRGENNLIYLLLTILLSAVTYLVMLSSSFILANIVTSVMAVSLAHGLRYFFMSDDNLQRQQEYLKQYSAYVSGTSTVQNYAGVVWNTLVSLNDEEKQSATFMSSIIALVLIVFGIIYIPLNMVTDSLYAMAMLQAITAYVIATVFMYRITWKYYNQHNRDDEPGMRFMATIYLLVSTFVMIMASIETEMLLPQAIGWTSLALIVPYGVGAIIAELKDKFDDAMSEFKKSQQQNDEKIVTLDEEIKKLRDGLQISITESKNLRIKIISIMPKWIYNIKSNIHGHDGHDLNEQEENYNPRNAYITYLSKNKNKGKPSKETFVKWYNENYPLIGGGSMD